VSAVGRNAPCPCGSGRKFKKCCLGTERVDGPAARSFTPADRERALAELTAFAHRPAFTAACEAAEVIFWGEALDGLPDDEAEALDEVAQSDYAFHLWLCFDFPIELDGPALAGRTLADLLLEQSRGRLGAGEREYLARMRPTHLRLYEVIEVKPEEGLWLVDLWTDQRLWVRERLATRQLVRWDLLAVRLMPGADGDLVIDGPPYPFPASEREDLLDGLRAAHTEFTRAFPGADVGTFFKQAGALFHQLALGSARSRPALVTPEGDPFIFARVVFDVRDEEAVTRALASHEDLARQDDGSYVWLGVLGRKRRAARDADERRVVLESSHLVPGGPPRPSLGTFALTGSRLVFETTSRPRARRGRRFLEGLLGESVRFRVTRYQDVDRALEAQEPAARPGGEGRPPIPPEVEARLMTELQDQHYRQWVDAPVPMLQDLTPRQAVRLETVRPRLIALLKEMESRAERDRREGRPAYDPGWLWAELGLERPE